MTANNILTAGRDGCPALRGEAKEDRPAREGQGMLHEGSPALTAGAAYAAAAAPARVSPGAQAPAGRSWQPGALVAGLLLTGSIAAAAQWLSSQPWAQTHGIAALTLAIVLGMLVGNTVYPSVAGRLGAGVDFSKTRLLRAGIVLYGLRLTFSDVALVGYEGVLLDACMLLSTFCLAWWLGTRWLGLDRQTALLIGAGSSICGAAAVMAAGPVVGGRAAQISVAVATVVIFGTLAMFAWPALYHLGQEWGWGHMDTRQAGVFIGATVHEVAQVVAAGRALGSDAADAAVIAKMVRVMMLAPFLLGLALLLARRGASNGAPGPGRRGIAIPWFAFGFILMAAFNSLVELPSELVRVALDLDTIMLAMAMAALGLTTHVSALRRAGLRPLLLAAMLFAWLLGGGLAMNALVHALLA
ncbi:YeiH family protein [Kerstersia gyiorum]|uniref:YeiH family protein n=1 Tax=Kerstersia gyiorum TaxID=206506 RepID=UPI00209774FE|nr:YeiH family protein [Kerstersia gyiorum]MCO7639170.1 YeiH family protein [Pseudomonas sp. S 311-6]MCP1679568.1 putative integral membrane protein (TIGR00698 family) [Kerstersia gyiorum]MCP1712949.1 putative integral membrane protein (TIGR00698 family) [Kerstersia gyiorum]MCP1824071.1 putative integral membrane protein (TIGR00698 family) [Kerstersia gyiorum]MCP1827610.1 putative integral membrane protein (TIGR00698 family) [Kerstersia gyiorum]